MEMRAFIESREEIEAILVEETIGFLGMCLEGQPYVVPLNYGYVEGRILFHGAFTGKKMDLLRANPQVCFSVGRQPGQIRRHAKGEPCNVDSDSVICTGRARVIEDLTERKQALDEFNRCFRPDAEQISPKAAEGCCAVEIRISEMTGRRERVEGCTYWRYRFEQ
jgi:nitroimidazol reductase NimA-like FMN-containing flavoprotein (pyridoxamine 5'-phosphate oxidase superfamily)